MDLGSPISFYVLERGAPVFASDGDRVGVVAEVRADDNADIFDALVVERTRLGGSPHLVVADQVEEIYEHGVVLRLDSRAVAALPAPG